VSSPAPLGTLVTFEANVGDANGAPVAYRFRTRLSPSRLDRRPRAAADIGSYRTVMDFGPKAALPWTTIEREGVYEIEVTARNNSTFQTATHVLRFEFAKLANPGPVVTPTENPLVFIYSAPPCPEGSWLRARFAPADGSGREQATPPQECDGRSTMNFYLAGMAAAKEYRAWHTVNTGGAVMDGPAATFTSGVVTLNLTLPSPISTPAPDYAGILLQGILNSRPIATDLDGNLVWYGPEGISMLTRVGAGGTILGVFEDGTKGPIEQTFREIDLAGVTIAETNAQRVNEQLMARGARPITSFHHEAIRMPNGNFLLLAGSEQLLMDVQGSGMTDILGDTIVVLDRDLQLLWYWDSFDHMDVKRAAILEETCSYPATLACSTFYEAARANDWLHGNSLQLTPDGNIVYSIRHQDWVAKIDYRHGQGDGHVIWLLGMHGSFTLEEGDETAWFSHQHDAQVLADGVTLILFDNGNTRIARNSDRGNSRGQVWRLDEESRTARLVLNADLGVNASALGSAQLLPNGNYHFDAGFIVDPANRARRFTQALEVDPGGNIVWGMQSQSQQYRNFRLDDLYTPPLP
jgi:hypothetical protein